MGLKITGLSGIASGVRATLSDAELRRGAWIGTDADCSAKLPGNAQGSIRGKHCFVQLVDDCITITAMRNALTAIDQQPVGDEGAIIVGPTALQLAGGVALFSVEPVHDEPLIAGRTISPPMSNEPMAIPLRQTASATQTSFRSTVDAANNALSQMFLTLTKINAFVCVASLVLGILMWDTANRGLMLQISGACFVATIVCSQLAVGTRTAGTKRTFWG